MGRIIRFLICGLFAAILPACSGDHATRPQPLYKGTFWLAAPYHYIRSQAGGGGIFLVQLVPAQNFSGSVELRLAAETCLHARLDRSSLSADSPVAELTLAPESTVPPGRYEIEVTAGGTSLSLPLELTVEVMQWSLGNLEDVLPRLGQFLQWLKQSHPEIPDLKEQKWSAFLTYPQILVVSHWTFLSPEYEIRLCYHVMIPPYDWSYYRIRQRGIIEPILAAKRDSYGQPIYQIPVADYPLMYGY